MTGTSIDALYWFLSKTEEITLRSKRFSVSRFLRVFKRNGLVALIHQLRPEPVYLLEKTWHNFHDRLVAGTLSTKMRALVQELIARRIFISNLNTDLQELKEARDQALQLLDRPTILYLMMAQGYNFACTYCPIPALAKRYGEHLLSFEDAIAGIKLWQKHIKEQPQDGNPYFLIFYGGEPLLNREVIERLLPYVAEEQSAGWLPKRLELMLCTNGSLVDERLSKLLARHKVTVAVGVDGPREHNDRIRLTIAGSPTFVEIERVSGNS